MSALKSSPQKQSRSKATRPGRYASCTVYVMPFALWQEFHYSNETSRRQSALPHLLHLAVQKSEVLSAHAQGVSERASHWPFERRNTLIKKKKTFVPSIVEAV